MCNCGTEPKPNAPPFVEVRLEELFFPAFSVSRLQRRFIPPSFREETNNFCSKEAVFWYQQSNSRIRSIFTPFLNYEISRVWDAVCQCKKCVKPGNCPCALYLIRVDYEVPVNESYTIWEARSQTLTARGEFWGFDTVVEGSNPLSRRGVLLLNCFQFQPRTSVCVPYKDRIIVAGYDNRGFRFRNPRLTVLSRVDGQPDNCPSIFPRQPNPPLLPPVPFSPDNFIFPPPPSPDPCKPTFPRIPSPFDCDCPDSPPNLPDEPDLLPPPPLPFVPAPIPLPPKLFPPIIDPPDLDKIVPKDCCETVREIKAISLKLDTRLFEVKNNVEQVRLDLGKTQSFVVKIDTQTRNLDFRTEQARLFAQQAFKKADEAAFLSKQIKPFHEAQISRINSLQLWIQGTILGAITAQGIALAGLIQGIVALVITGIRAEFLKLFFELKSLETQIIFQIEKSKAEIIAALKAIRIVTQQVSVTTEKPVIRTQEVRVVQQIVEVKTEQVKVTTQQVDLSSVFSALREVQSQIRGVDGKVQRVLDDQVTLVPAQFSVANCTSSGLTLAPFSGVTLKSKNYSLVATTQALLNQILTVETCKSEENSNWVPQFLGEVETSQLFTFPENTEAVRISITEIPKGRSARLNMESPLNYPNSGWFSWVSEEWIWAEERIEYEQSFFAKPLEKKVSGCYVSCYKGYYLEVFALVRS